MSIIKSIVNWFGVGKPSPTPADATTQLGVHYEEVIESIKALNTPVDISDLKRLADQLKKMDNDQSIEFLNKVDHVELNDGLCDTTVTSTGSSYMLGYYTIPSLLEVDSSNWSKYENGRVLKDENGKIQKGRDYFKPKLKELSYPNVLSGVSNGDNK